MNVFANLVFERVLFLNEIETLNITLPICNQYNTTML